jgi:cell division protein FtsQ
MTKARTATRKTTSVKRGKAARPRTARRKPHGPSIMQRLLEWQPFPPAVIRKAVVVASLGIVTIGGWQVARVSGMTAWMHQEMVDAVGRAGFSVQRIEVLGANRIDRLHVYDIALNQKDRSMAAFDLEEVRRDLLSYGWVADARVSRRLPDTLVIDLVERTPVAVWQNQGRYTLMDRRGNLLPGVEASSVPNLPVIVGTDAPKQMASLQQLLETAPALRPQITGASWIGNRRWDLHFKAGETLALPDDPDRARDALAEFARLDGVNRLLGRGIRRFDMRLPDKLVLRRGREGDLGDLGAMTGSNRQVETVSGDET